MTEMPASAPPRPGASPLARNVAFTTVGTTLSNVCLYLSNWAIVRYYTPDLHGTVAWLVGVVVLSMMLTDLGLATKGSVRRIARSRAGRDDLDEAVSTLMTVPTLLATVAAVLVALAVASTIGQRPGVTGWAAVLTAAWIGCLAVERVGQTLATGLQRMGWTLAMRPVAEGAKLAWVVVCWLAGLDFLWLLIGWTVAYALSAAMAVLSAVVLSRRFRFHPRVRLTSLGKTLGTLGGTLPYYLPQLWLMGMPMAMRLVIGSHWPAEMISVFQVFWSLAAVSRLAALPISQSIFPMIAEADGRGDGHLGTAQVLRSSVRMLGWVSTSLLAGLWAFGPWLLPALYGPVAGPMYVEHLTGLLLLIIAVGIENVSILLDQVLMATSAALLARVELGKMALMAVAVVVAVPAGGVLGAAAAYLAVAVAATGVKLVLTQRRIDASGAGALAATLVTFLATAAAGLAVGRWWAILPTALVAGIASGLMRRRDLRLWARTGWRVVTSVTGVRPGRV
ncbi:MAG: lipopolysaccharide biosynthesis protein [Planctomycetota bacterium]